MGESRNRGREPRSDAVRVVFCYGLDQQGGKGGANYLKNICPTILSDSHGTPHAVCYAIDHVVTGGGNCTAQGKCWYEEVSPTLKSAGVHAVCYTPTLVLNDQGGAIMHISYDVTSTLRSQTKHHEPIVLIYDARGNGGATYPPQLQEITKTE